MHLCSESPECIAIIQSSKFYVIFLQVTKYITFLLDSFGSFTTIEASSQSEISSSRSRDLCHLHTDSIRGPYSSVVLSTLIPLSLDKRLRLKDQEKINGIFVHKMSKCHMLSQQCEVHHNSESTKILRVKLHCSAKTCGIPKCRNSIRR